MNAIGYLIITVSIVVIFGLSFFLIRQQSNFQEERRQLARNLEESEHLRAKVEEQIQAIMHVSQNFIDATNEREIIDSLLKLSMDLNKAQGASFVPLNDHGQPMAFFRKGDFPFEAPGAWLENLASTSFRESCQRCKDLNSHAHKCPLLEAPFSEGMGLYCFPLRYGELDLGMLNLYLPESSQLEGESLALMRSLVDSAALAMEGERLRQRELVTFSQIRASRQRSEISTSLANILEILCQSVDAEYGAIFLDPSHPIATNDGVHQRQLHEQQLVTWGPISGLELTQMGELFDKTLQTGNRILLSNDELPAKISTGLVVPLLSPTSKPFGVLFLGSCKLKAFHQRQLSLARIVSEQASLLIQNVDHLASLEYQAIIEERTRLAREIHDGLAQTLGYLKLQMAKMFSYQERGEQERLVQTMRMNYEALDSAYQDVREVIDGLRIGVDEKKQDNLENWLRQIVQSFSQEDGPQSLRVSLSAFRVQTNFPPEIQAQLIRIVQESLSNVRKHARARQAWISCIQVDTDLILEIRDDGQGFCPEDVPGTSRHGLQGMRERSELIGADLQVISQPGEGTIVKIRLPVKER